MVEDALDRVLQDPNSRIDIVPATNTVHSSPKPACMDPSSSSCNSQADQMVCDLLHNVVEDALNRVLQPSEPSNPASSGLFYEIHRVDMTLKLIKTPQKVLFKPKLTFF